MALDCLSRGMGRVAIHAANAAKLGRVVTP